MHKDIKELTNEIKDLDNNINNIYNSIHNTVKAQNNLLCDKIKDRLNGKKPEHLTDKQWNEYKKVGLKLLKNGL